MNKREVGRKYEELAKRHLILTGYDIIEQNFTTRIGEIDIIAKNDGYLCFVEVKYRKENSIVDGVYAVDIKKQKTIYNVAKIYMSKNNISENTPCRFDVVSVKGEKVTLIKNAFP